MSDHSAIQDKIREAVDEHNEGDGVINAWVIAYSVVKPEEGAFGHNLIASEGNDFMTHLGLSTYLKAGMEQISVGGKADEE